MSNVQICLDFLIVPSFLLFSYSAPHFPLSPPNNHLPTRLPPPFPVPNVSGTTLYGRKQDKSDAAKCTVEVNVRICIALYVVGFNGSEGPQTTFLFC